MRADDAFREKYGGFVVGVHRHGVPLLPLESVEFESGDSALILTTDAFATSFARDSTFALIKAVASYKQRRHKYAPACGTIALILMIVLSQVLNEPQYGNIRILKTALCGMIFMAMTGCVSQIEMGCAILIPSFRFGVACSCFRCTKLAVVVEASPLTVRVDWRRAGAKIDLLIMIAVGFGLSEALTVSGGAKMVASVSWQNTLLGCRGE
jgi:hypothetical protein